MKKSLVLKYQKRDVENEISRYRLRKNQLDDICRNLNCNFEDCAIDISNHCNNVNRSVSSGIRLERGSTSTENLFRREEGIGDYNLSQSKNYIVSEINSVNNKIADLERESARLGKSIRTAEIREREESRR